MQHFKIINIHTNKEINLNYTELQDFMSINRKDFFYNYTIQRIQKTPIEQKILLSILFFACSLVIGVMILETFVFLTN